MIVFCLPLLLAWTPSACPSPQASQTIAEGTFVVTLTPLTDDGPIRDEKLGRMALEKVFKGDLEGESKGMMLTAVTATPGSAGYVAIEKVTARLADRSGSFVLQHSGTMHAGSQSLEITVVPGSGAGGLEGITGSMTITIEDGTHYYSFTYGFDTEK